MEVYNEKIILTRGGVLLRFSAYTNIIRHNDYYLLHNSLYNKTIKITSSNLKEEIDIFSSTEFELDSKNNFHTALLANKMVIEEDFDESAIVRLLDMQNVNTFLLTLIVTRGCNFDCYYCYERHESAKKMSSSVYNQIIEFIKKEVKKQNYTHIHFSLFGGEPTLCLDNIFSFLKQVAKELPEIKISGSMTTNAYLLNLENFTTLLNHNINDFQITLDGLEKTHNKSRFLVNGKGTWNEIVKNLKDISNLDNKYQFSVNLRTNITKDVLEDADEYCRFYKYNFGSDKRFSISFEGVKDFNKDIEAEKNLVESEVTAIDEFFEISKKYEIGHRFNIKYTRLFGLVCSAGKTNNYVIDYNGDLLKCTLRIYDEFNKIGNIFNDELDLKKLSRFVSYRSEEKCFKCGIYPICYSKKCPLNNFDEDYCELLKTLYKDSLINLYIKEKEDITT